MTLIAQIEPHSGPAPLTFLRRIVPGVLACLAVTGAAMVLAQIERQLFGATWLEPLVLAILLGAAVRLVWTPHERFAPGIDFSARTLLEIAIVLLGASISAATLSSLGPVFVLGIALLVVLAIGLGFIVGRLLGLNPRMALLVACGNAICGNSAIAAIAPVIEAEGDDIAASIAFTAVLGVVVVLALPVLGVALGLGTVAFGALAGLTVYAVPQVLAAAAPFGALAMQTGTVVKLVRVLMLGPVVLMLSLLMGHKRSSGADGREGLKFGRLLPWFIVGFLAVTVLRLMDLIPHVALPAMAETSGLLTVIAMSALGLQTHLGSVARSGGRVAAAAVLSLAGLTLLALILIRFV